MPLRMIAAPWAASSVAMARPMPLVEPVTRAVRPARGRAWGMRVLWDRRGGFHRWAGGDAVRFVESNAPRDCRGSLRERRNDDVGDCSGPVCEFRDDNVGGLRAHCWPGISMCLCSAQAM